jgi:HSP20 family protein
MRRFSEDMERLFEGFWNDPASSGSWSPPVEIIERDGHLVVRTDLPGMKAEDVQVAVEDDRLNVKGQRKQEFKNEQEGYYHSERSYGSFYRCIPLPDGVDADNVKARFEDGVLEIRMPAPHEKKERGRTIPVESGSVPAHTR